MIGWIVGGMAGLGIVGLACYSMISISSKCSREDELVSYGTVGWAADRWDKFRTLTVVNNGDFVE